jgi:thiol-disulfide isomerase/thioredoxin
VKPSFRSALTGVALLSVLALALAAPASLSAQPAANVSAIDGPALKKAIQDQKGKVVVVNVWATWCEPCVEEFPDLVKFHKAYRDKGVVVIAASADEPGDKAEVEKFVQQNGAEFPVYIRKAGRVEKFIDPIAKNWSGAVPMTLIYGKDGKLWRRPLIGMITNDMLTRAVEPLLKK